MGAVRTTWVADDPTWSVLLQRDAVRKAGDALAVNTQDLLTYHHSGLEVVGRSDPVPVTAEFHRIPPYHCYGLPPEDYPRVFADPGARSPHRMPEDERLCLWAPFDPPEQRWTAPDGRQRLLDITAVHLFAEEYWRHTGGVDEDGVEIGTWPIPQAAHGPPAPAATSRAHQTTDCNAGRLAAGPTTSDEEHADMNVVFSGVGGAFVAAVVAVLGYSVQQREARKVARATMYAHALQAVPDYLEGPYRIRRKDGSSEARRELTQAMSTVQSQMKFHTAWPEVGAPTAVASAYADLVTSAAWAEPPPKDDGGVPLGVAYSWPRSDAALDTVKASMKRHR